MTMGSFCLKGEKVILYPLQELLTPDNLKKIYSWHKDQETMFWMGCKPVKSSFTSFVSWFHRSVKELGPELAFGIIDGGGKLIGRISCYGLDDKKQEGEVGILIGEKSLWGKGYGRDALVTFLRYLFDEVGLKKVRLRTLYRNIRARRCFSRCGFKESRTLTLFLEIGEIPGVEMILSAEDFYRTLNERRLTCKSDGF